ncbi:MAG TPA: Uma2 family endonuclease, partial [Ktedonobacteraceae bacterium]|nr:Uma2 family endonuclease [Ktedonobacteraceae bacterium]
TTAMISTFVTSPTLVPVENIGGIEQGHWTAQDYTTLPEDGQRYEIMQGVLLRLAPLNGIYQETLRRLSYYLNLHIRTSRFGHTYMAPDYLALASDVVVQPNFFAIGHKNQETAVESPVALTPDLIVEVSTPSDLRYHWREKYDAYARANVAEYWIVLPAAKSIEVLVLEQDEYRSLGVFEGQARVCSRVLPCFSLSAEKFFAQSKNRLKTFIEDQDRPLAISTGTGSRKTPLPFLPPRYQDGCAVSAKPMGAAPLRYADDGQVAWDKTWEDFCEVALAGGPPHRGTLLEPVSPDEVAANPEAYERVVAEIERGLQLVTGLTTVRCPTPGWVGLDCQNETMALWLLRAIAAENVCVRREGNVLFLPAGPSFRVEAEIKNVVTSVAKTNHYWTELCAVLYDR